jgi:hypothetical protein
MKLVFKKSEDKQITVFQDVNGKQNDFSYVDMIKDLIITKNMESPDISDGFTAAEISSIKSMVSFINREISLTKDADASS